jgi:hypothetical protein
MADRHAILKRHALELFAETRPHACTIIHSETLLVDLENIGW